MKITVAESAGFCKGVQSAFDMALKLADEYGRIYTVGALVHNELVTEFLQSKGIFCINPDKVDELKQGDVALIRAHGIPIELEQIMKDKGILVFDATCPVVKRNQRIAQERADLGDKVVIIGDEKHDEVAGVRSRAGAYAQVLGEKDALDFLNSSTIQNATANTSILFQTTILADKYAQIEDLVNNFPKNTEKSVGIFNTICYTTKARQDEARVLARDNDAVLVLGSRTSANTMRLYEVAKDVNSNTFFVANADQVKLLPIFEKDIQRISIVAGASTPPWLIQEVTELMSETQKTVAENAAETEVKNEATLQEKQNAVKTEAAPEKELTMEDVMASNRSVGYTDYKVGKRKECTVIRADESGIFVAIGGKKDGFIDKSEATLEGTYNPTDYNAGDKVEAEILSVNKDYVSLSKKAVDARRAEDAEAEKALSAGEFSLVMTEVVKGGLRGRLGQYTIFVPASQIKIGYVSNLEDYKGKSLRLVLMPPKEKEAPAPQEGAAVEEGAEVAQVAEQPVVEQTASEQAASEEKAQRKSRYLFASQRMVLEKERKEKEDLFWDSIHVHDIVVGKVKRFTAFGAFVSVRGFDCLAHISELSWNKIADPSKVLTIGENYDFVVLKMDRETGKISLGFKQLQKKPYEVAAEKYPVGTVIKGKVERIFPYGAFISIDEGVDGLVHVSQISHNWIKDANEALTIGQEVDAKIIGFDDNRITLSIKELLPAPEESAVETEFIEIEGEDKAKRQSRVKKFEQKLADSEGKRDRRGSRRENSNEPKEWVSGNSSATLGDLFKNLNLNLNDEGEAAPEAVEVVEEAPKKRATRKKKVETEEAAE